MLLPLARGLAAMTSAIMDGTRWDAVGKELDDITYHRAVDSGTVRIAFDRPTVRNAFRPKTVDELYAALDHARQQSDVGCVLLTGNGPSPDDGGWAFSAGGDINAQVEGYESFFRDLDGQTPLHGAAGWGWTKVVRFLVQRGARIDIQDAEGHTPVDLAMGRTGGRSSEPHNDTAQLLRKLCADKSGCALSKARPLQP
jgi:hypothetical protein